MRKLQKLRIRIFAVFRDGGGALLLLYGRHISSATRRLEDTEDPTLLEVINHDLHLIAKSLAIPMAGLLFIVALTRLLCDPVTEDPSYQPAPEDRPGGFQWGQVVINFPLFLPCFCSFLYWPVLSWGCCQMLVLCSFFALHKIFPRQAGDGDADREDEEDEE